MKKLIFDLLLIKDYEKRKNIDEVLNYINDNYVINKERINFNIINIFRIKIIEKENIEKTQTKNSIGFFIKIKKENENEYCYYLLIIGMEPINNIKGNTILIEYYTSRKYFKEIKINSSERVIHNCGCSNLNIIIIGILSEDKIHECFFLSLYDENIKDFIK